MFPYFYQPQRSIKDIIDELKAIEEWQKSLKPKDDKPKNPDAWTTADYVTFTTFVFAVTVPVCSVIALSYIVDMIKVLQHT